MDTSTQQYAKTTLLSSALFVPALATAIWAGYLDGGQCVAAVLGAIGLALGTFCFLRRRDDLVHDFFLPIILFAALGGMTWAVRGSSGFGAVKGCVFAGVMWGAAWWFIARDPGNEQRRRYASGWIILALTLGIGLAGGRGWMQWSNFFDGMLQTDAAKGEGVPISPYYGMIWLFIAGMPWAGLGACALAWCAAEKPLAAWQWAVRLFCGFGAAFFASWLFEHYPQWFLPLYSTMKDRYADLEANPNLRRLINDNGAAVRHMGFYLGFLLFELGRRDWKNVTLISTVGILNGLGWALCQNWKWADNVWPEAQFNFWRAWESSGGISIGIAYGVAYYLVNRKQSSTAAAPAAAAARSGFPWFGALSITFMLAALIWFVAGNVGVMFSAEWRDHLDGLAFCAVLTYGAVLYGGRLRAAITAGPGATAPARPGFAGWLATYGLMLLIAWFMMDLVQYRGSRVPATLWWGHFDYMYLGVTVAYGVFFVLSYAWVTLSARPEHTAKANLFFTRYPNFDWLATYLSLAIILCSFLRGELPAWQGWLWVVREDENAWNGMLGLACLVFFGVVYCLLSYWSSRGTTDTGEGRHGLDPNLERFGVYLGLLVGLGMSLKNGTRGWANIYWGDEDHWGQVFWRYIGPSMLVGLVAIILLVLIRRIPRGDKRDPVPHAFALIVLVLAHQNLLAHAITGPPSNWSEVVFNIYYVLLFLMTAAVFYHYHFIQTRLPALAAGSTTPKNSAPLADETETPAYTREITAYGAYEALEPAEPESMTTAYEAAPEAPAESEPETPEAEVYEEETVNADLIETDELEAETLAAEVDEASEPLETPLELAGEEAPSDLELSPMFDEDEEVPSVEQRGEVPDTLAENGAAGDDVPGETEIAHSNDEEQDLDRRA